MKKILMLFIVFTFTLVVTGCSSFLKIPDFSVWIKGNLEAADYWRARGKFSYRSSAITESGNFDWRQKGENYQLRLFGPLGMGTLRISGNANLVRIRTGDQDISSDQPLSLLHRMTGFEIPLNSMPMWLLGQPASSPAEVTLNAEGQIQNFSERQWLLSYSDYQEFGKEPDTRQIPTMINAHKEGINLRMLVYTWKAE